MASRKCQSSSYGNTKGKECRKTKGRRKKDIIKKSENKGVDTDICLNKNEEISCHALHNHPTSPVKVASVPTENLESSLCISNEFKKVEITQAKDEDYHINCVDDENDHSKTQVQSTLKYNYKEDQWSPLNPEGKKHYDREFLLCLQSQPMSMRKPSNLPNLEVIKNEIIQHRLPDIIKTSFTPLQSRTPDLFVPHFVGSRNSRPPHSGVGRRQSQQGRDKPKKVITISTSLNQDVKLHESENAWKPSLKNANNDSSNAKTQEVYKKVKGILNKLTPQKFQTLVTQVKQLEVNTQERLKGVIDLVFEKAVDEPNFSVPYANMCKQLAMLKVPLEENAEGQCVNFRKLLLTKCQREFEKDRSDEIRREEKLKEIEQAESEEKKRQLKEYLEEDERQSRRRSLGNIRFIGELFKLGMLTESIMHGCLKQLLSQDDEDSIECLCRLLTTIGKELEGDKNKCNKDNLMDEYFREMRKIVDKRQVTSRVRFMLQDVIDLRQNFWVPRWNENNPKTIDQIHKEAEQEAHEQQHLLQQAVFQRNSDRDRRKGRSNLPAAEEGWSISSSKNRVNYNVDHMKLKLTKPTEVENIQLQPGSRPFSTWRCGSSGGAKSSGQEIELKSTLLSNRFLPLTPDQGPCHMPRRSSQRSAASSRESSHGRGNQFSHPPVRKIPSQSTSKEREQLIEAVKILNKSSSTEKRSQDIRSLPSIENEINSSGIDNALKGGNLSRSEVETKTISLIDEFLHNCDFDEAVQCVTELTSASTIHIFISAAINHILERSNQARQLLGELLHKLLKKGIINLDEYVKGLKSVLELADDYAIDVPMIWEYLGELIEPVFEDSTIPPSFLKNAAEPLVTSCTAGKLVSEVLHAAVKKKGYIKVGELWRNSRLKWSDFVSPCEDVQKFLDDHKLHFTMQCMDSHPVVNLTQSEVTQQLDFLLRKKQTDNKEIFEWIESNVGEKTVEESWFLRALITTVAESAIHGEDASSHVEQEKFKQRISLLQRYIDHKEHLELQALYALQALMEHLHHPKGVLKHIFDILYDEDLISEDSFKKWQGSDDPSEQGGKGVALHSVGSFFKWLQEADEESSNEN